MTDLTKKETAYFITFTILAFTIMFASLFFWLQIEVDNNCWNNYTTEEQAIINCEGE